MTPLQRAQRLWAKGHRRLELVNGAGTLGLFQLRGEGLGVRVTHTRHAREGGGGGTMTYADYEGLEAAMAAAVLQIETAPTLWRLNLRRSQTHAAVIIESLREWDMVALPTNPHHAAPQAARRALHRDLIDGCVAGRWAARVRYEEHGPRWVTQLIAADSDPRAIQHARFSRIDLILRRPIAAAVAAHTPLHRRLFCSAEALTEPRLVTAWRRGDWQLFLLEGGRLEAVSGARYGEDDPISTDLQVESAGVRGELYACAEHQDHVVALITWTSSYCVDDETTKWLVRCGPEDWREIPEPRSTSRQLVHRASIVG